MHGDGQLITEKGEVFKGQWKNGQTQDMKKTDQSGETIKKN